MDLRLRGGEWARLLERLRMRNRLRARVLPGLDALSDPHGEPEAMIAAADRQARLLRRELEDSAMSSSRYGFTADLDAPAQAAREAERSWVCGHLHDTALQILEFIAGDGFATGLSAPQIAALAGGAARDLRKWLDTPPHTTGTELLAELNQVTEEARTRCDQQVELVIGRVESPPCGERACALAGAVREALTNARKHAHASRVVVHLEASDGEASITVTDDGVGIDYSRLGRGLGIANSIVGRMRGVGGHASIQRAPGGGTRVELTTHSPQEA